MSGYSENTGVYYNRSDYASFTKRVIIAFVDLIVILLISVLILYISNFFINNVETYLDFNFSSFILVSVIYLAFLKRSKYRTLGYIITGVKIVNLKGEKPSIFRMILRVGLLMVGPFELVIDIIWLTSEMTRQTLRDKYVGTYVINQNANPEGYVKLQNVSLGVMGWNLSYREIKECNIK